MSDNDQQLRDLIAEQAAEWFVENRAGLTAAQRREFGAWIKASPVHVEEYLALAALTRDLASAARPGDESEQETVARALADHDPPVRDLRPRAATHPRTPPARWPGLAVAASVVLLASGLLGVWVYRQAGPRPVAGTAALHFRTRHGEQQTFRLADQSLVHLNTDTAITVRFDAQARRVELEAGEAAFEVAHESRRAFQVSAGSAQVIAVGTQFDVRLAPTSTLVTVAEGRVKVSLALDEPAARYQEVGAGEQLEVIPGEWPARLVAANVVRATSWLEGKLRFDDETLAHVVSELNRYVATPFEITSPSLMNLKISGVFATDDPQAFTAFLRSLKGVHVVVTSTRILVSQP